MSAADNSGLRKGLVQVGDAVSQACTILAAASLAVIVCINGANVVGRYFFSAPISWAEELMLFLMILTVFAGAVTVTWRQEHIKIDALLMRLPPKLRALAIVFTGLVTLGALGTTIYSGGAVVMMLQGFDQRSDALEFPMWIAQSSAPVGLALIVFLFLVRAYVSIGQSSGDANAGQGPIA